MHTVMDIAEHYPPQVLRLLMNHIGTHDTERAITALAGEPDGGRDRDCLLYTSGLLYLSQRGPV